MHVGYCEVYSYNFRLFLDAWSESSWNSLLVLKERKGTKVPRNESSWNVRSRVTEVPQQRKFQGANVPQNESSICGLFAPGNESAEEQKVCRSTSSSHY